jgi:hypothetical protein
MPSPAVLLISDSNFFHKIRNGSNVYDLVRARMEGAACYGLWEKRLRRVTTKIEDMLRFIHLMGVYEVMIILCLGQHDILEDEQDQLGVSVGKLTQLVEKYQARLVVVELFDHSAFAVSKEGYATGVANLNMLWKHEAWADPAVEVVAASIRDDDFIDDLMHLQAKGVNKLCDVLVTKINEFILPHRCLA